MNSKSMAGWIGFAGLVMLILGGINFFQGLIAAFEDDYYLVTQSGYLVFDVSTWGWILMVWGLLLVLVGIGLPARWAGHAVRHFPRVAELLRPARLSRQQQLPTLGADLAGAERDRPLRADCTLGREPGRLSTTR